MNQPTTGEFFPPHLLEELKGLASLTSHSLIPSSSRCKGDFHWKHVQSEMHLKPQIKSWLGSGEILLLNRLRQRKRKVASKNLGVSQPTHRSFHDSWGSQRCGLQERLLRVRARPLADRGGRLRTVTTATERQNSSPHFHSHLGSSKSPSEAP